MKIRGKKGSGLTKGWRKVCSALITVGLICGAAFVARAESEPKAWIASYADGRTTSLRVSEMLEVHTSGFSDEASFDYKYSGTACGKYYSPDTASFSRTYGDLRYFAISGSKAVQGEVKVTVTDKNSESPTYGKTATASYKNFLASSLKSDLSGSAYGMFVGDNKSLLTLLGNAGILHITCGNSKTKSVTLSSGSSVSISGKGNDTKIKGVAEGVSTCRVSVEKTKSCTYHPGNSGSGDISLYVFRKPTVTPVESDQLVLTNTQAGVTYSINGVSQKCTKDGQELTFSGLSRCTVYAVACSIQVKGKNAVAYTEGKTGNKVVVKFNNKKKGDKQVPNQSVDYKSKLKEPAKADEPTEPGYYLEGWYEEPEAYMFKWNFESMVAYRNMTLYARWEDVPNTLNLTLKKDGEVWSGKNVELYQGTDKVYSLSQRGGVYSNSTIKNGTYDIYVNGENTYRQVSFATKGTTPDSGETVAMTFEYVSVDIETTLNDKTSNVPGDIELHQGSVVWNKFSNHDGKIRGYALKDGDGKSGSIYDIYVGGKKVREQVDAEKANSFTIGFYKPELALTFDKVWNDAIVTLRDADGVEQYRLDYEESQGNVNYYRSMIQADLPDSDKVYEVYVGGQNTHEQVRIAQGKAEPSDYQKKTVFYEAAVTICTDDKPDSLEKVFVDNGQDTTQLSDLDMDGIYTENLLLNTADGTETAYNITVKGAMAANEEQLTSSSPKVQLDYYHVYCHITSAGTDITSTMLVRKNAKIETPASPVNNGRSIEGWYTDKAFKNSYDFTKQITAPLHIYGKFEGQKAQINGYIKTDSSGTTSSTGSYYRMANLTISGFPSGDVMTGFLLETTGCSTVTIKPDSSVGSFNIMPDNHLSGNVVTISEGTVLVQFNSKVTMKEMQTFLRNNVIVQPDTSKNHTMQVTVYGETD